MELPFSNLMSAAGLLMLSIFVGVHGGKIAAHRLFATRLFTVRGPAAVVLGAIMLLVGLAGVAYSWYVGLRFGQ